MTTATAQRPARAGSRPAAPVPGAEHRSRPSSVLTTIVLGCVAILAFWWFGTPTSAGATPGTALVSAGELAGLLASFLVCAQVLLVARVPWFERAVGFDKLTSWHRSLGTTVVLLVVTHVLLMVVGGMFVDQATPWGEAMIMLRSYPEMLSALAGTAVFVVVGMSSARLMRRYLSHEWWFAVHLTIYLGIYLTFGHQVFGGRHLVGNPVAQTLWLTMYAGTGLAILWWRIGIPVLDNLRMGLRVETVVPEATGTVSVWLRGKGVDRLAARGGQFFLLRFMTAGHLATAHPYSVSIVPTDERLRFTIGALGDHSTAMRHIRPGTRVFVEGPFGRFTAGRSRSNRALLIAGGAGIGPVRALAEELVGAGRDVVVLHRGHSADRLALSREFPEAETLHYIPLTGRRRELGYDPLGPTSLGRLVPDIARRDVFICGPEGMTETVVASARALRVPRTAIHHEELSLS
ncbi:ferredoxin reductase family protein [Cellulomonas citrea]|uniref:ferredoxin reductase family protein n=1 Tax=Cellulomonas citrea TaxID=1909423 RepID=UPI0013582916|nr:ferredoxin reductase family protein [Cellulomonas citrea]